jgi:hypothetical protein
LGSRNIHRLGKLHRLKTGFSVPNPCNPCNPCQESPCPGPGWLKGGLEVAWETHGRRMRVALRWLWVPNRLPTACLPNVFGEAMRWLWAALPRLWPLFLLSTFCFLLLPECGFGVALGGFGRGKPHNGTGTADRKMEDRKMGFLPIFLSTIFLSLFLPAAAPPPDSLREGLLSAFLRESPRLCVKSGLPNPWLAED